MTLLRVVKPSEKPTTAPEKATGVTNDTIAVTPDELRSWLLPPCQRQLTVNPRLRALALSIQEDGGVIPEPLSLARLGGQVYIIDGQHRREAALRSKCEMLYAEVRWHHRVKSLDDIDEIFKRLQKRLVGMKPDDTLRASESGNVGLQRIRTACPYIGYDRIRRKGNGPMMSMSALARAWFGAVPERPSASHLGAETVEESIRVDRNNDVDNLIDFTRACFDAWGREESNKRLWGGLNLTLCAWLYQRTVSGSYSAKTPKISKDLFRRCLMSVAAAPFYSDWLEGRTLRERDRATAFGKLKQTFAKRIALETGKKPMLPQPAWSSH